VALRRFPPGTHFPILGIGYYFSKFFPSEFFLIIASVHDLPGAVTCGPGAGWNQMLGTNTTTRGKMNTRKISRITAVALGLALATTMAAAQVNSGAQTITLNAKLAESLTLGLSANAVNFTLAAGSATNAGSASITATTTWTLQPGRTAVGVYAYFTTTTALTDGAGNNIPSSAFFVADNTNPSTALTSNTPWSTGTGLQMANVAITGTNRSANRTDVMTFNIDLTSLPQLPAATYTGTLNIQAQAIT
jgi:hypothetical protein